jgi:hypothetical protein
MRTCTGWGAPKLTLLARTWACVYTEEATRAAGHTGGVASLTARGLKTLTVVLVHCLLQRGHPVAHRTFVIHVLQHVHVRTVRFNPFELHTRWARVRVLCCPARRGR